MKTTMQVFKDLLILEKYLDTANANLQDAKEQYNKLKKIHDNAFARFKNKIDSILTPVAEKQFKEKLKLVDIISYESQPKSNIVIRWDGKGKLYYISTKCVNIDKSKVDKLYFEFTKSSIDGFFSDVIAECYSLILKK